MSAYLANQSRPVNMRASRITTTNVRPPLGAMPQLRRPSRNHSHQHQHQGVTMVIT
jgi:hypothetical protein